MIVTPSDAKEKILLLQHGKKTLVSLDDEERKYALSTLITQTRKLYEELCKDYKYHRQSLEAYREPKIQCRELLSELRQKKKDMEEEKNGN